VFFFPSLFLSLSVVRAQLYGFGETTGDTLAEFQNTDDGSTSAVPIEHGIKLGCEVYDVMYVSRQRGREKTSERGERKWG